MQVQVESTQYVTDSSVFDQFDDGVLILDKGGAIRYNNRRACRLLGVPSDDIIGTLFGSLLSESDSLTFAEKFALYEEHDFEVDLHFPASDSWVRARGFCFHSGCVVTLKDISPLHQSDEALEVLRNKVRSLVDSNLVGVMTTLLDGRILEANEAFLKMVGYTAEELRNGSLSWEKLTPPEWKELSRQKVEEIRQSGKSVLFEKEYLAKDGRRVPVLVGSSLYNRKQGECVTLVMDLRAQKLAEKHAAALRESQEKVRARELFCAIASHELKTPLTSLNLHIGMLERSISKLLAESTEASKERVQRSLLQMRRSARKVGAMVNVLMDVTVLKSGQLTLHRENVDLVEVVSGALSEVVDSRYLNEGMIESNIPPAAPAWVDSMRIEQVVTNVLGNAIKYGEGKPVSVQLVSEDGTYRLTVCDRGRGIPEDQRARIFEKFERGIVQEEGIEGLGLGLYVSRGIVEAHGGRIWVDANPVGGSCFHFTVPKNPPERPPLH
jgi:PAS domain S-box-containing protein